MIAPHSNVTFLLQRSNPLLPTYPSPFIHKQRKKKKSKTKTPTKNPRSNLSLYKMSLSSSNIQKIWNNETFDGPNGSGKSTGWSVLQPISTNRLNSSDPDSCRENRSVGLIPKKSPAKKVKELEELGLDEEMEMIEGEIKRLTFRLEELKLKKASLVQKPGRVVPSKFMEAKPFSTLEKNSNLQIGTPESDKSRRRGVSLGPLEIQNSCKSAKKPNLKKLEEINEEEEEKKVPNQNSNLRNDKSRRRGVSLGPLEIQNSCKSAKKPNLKKLEEIKEEKSLKETKVPVTSSKSKYWGPKRGVSLGPLEIAAITKTPSKHQIKIAKKEEKPLKTEKKGSTSASSKTSLGSASSKTSLGKSKSLFDESDRRLSRGRGKSRVVPSRYSLAPVRINIRDEHNSKRRKWSLPNEEREEDLDTVTINESSAQSITKIAILLPKIKAVRFAVESPRDSGRAKRVADLAGKRPFFSNEGVSSYQDRV